MQPTVDYNNYITIKELVYFLLGSSGILALIFSVISKLIDKTTRVMIMNEIKCIDEKYQSKLIEVESDITNVKLNYLERFSEQKELITMNKEISAEQHSEIKQILVGIKKDLNSIQS